MHAAQDMFNARGFAPAPAPLSPSPFGGVVIGPNAQTPPPVGSTALPVGAQTPPPVGSMVGAQTPPPVASMMVAAPMGVATTSGVVAHGSGPVGSISAPGTGAASVPMGSGRVSYGTLHNSRVLAADSPEARALLLGGQRPPGVGTQPSLGTSAPVNVSVDVQRAPAGVGTQPSLGTSAPVNVSVDSIPIVPLAALMPPPSPRPAPQPKDVPVAVETSIPVAVESVSPVATETPREPPPAPSVAVLVETVASVAIQASDVDAAAGEVGPHIPKDAAAGAATQMSLCGFMNMAATQATSAVTLPMVMTSEAFGTPDVAATSQEDGQVDVTNPAAELSTSTTLPYVVVTQGTSWGADASIPAEETLPIVAMPVIKDPLVPPMSQQACGMNLMLSEDRYTATRCSGCRESVAVCGAPLQRQRRGLYFEVTVRKVVEGWLGGLAVGVTHTSPALLQQERVPDKGCNIPRTFIVGYSGSAHLNGEEVRCSWQPDRLREGQRVGLLITGDGREDMIVFVDEVETLRIEGTVLHNAGLSHEPLYPVIDVFNATLAVTLSRRAAPPEQ